jgi:hypothetical protein
MPFSELQQVNAIIGLSMRIEGWPSTLADHGYTLDRIELKFKVPDPRRPGVSIYINPDLLFVADVRNLSLIVELKSGRFQDFEQLNRAVLITPLELFRYGGVPVTERSHIGTHKIGVAEIVNEEFLAEYLAEFQRVMHVASLVSIGNSAIQSHHGTLPDSKLDRVLKAGVSLQGYHPPTKLVPVLPTSDDEYGLVSSVVDGVKQLWVNNTRTVVPSDVGRTIFRKLWERFGREAQSRYLSIAKEVLSDMVQTEFHAYLRPVPNERDKWALIQLPESVAERHRTKAYQQFGNVAREYKWRRKNGGEYARRHPSQITLDDIPGFTPSGDKDGSDSG